MEKKTLKLNIPTCSIVQIYLRGTVELHPDCWRNEKSSTLGPKILAPFIGSNNSFHAVMRSQVRCRGATVYELHHIAGQLIRFSREQFTVQYEPCHRCVKKETRHLSSLAKLEHSTQLRFTLFNKTTVHSLSRLRTLKRNFVNFISHSLKDQHRARVQEVRSDVTSFAFYIGTHYATVSARSNSRIPDQTHTRTIA